MKTKKMVLITGVSAGFVALTALVGFYQVSQTVENTRAYLEHLLEPKVMRGYKVLSPVGLRDMPGYSGAFGKSEASRIAKDLLAEENDAYAKVSPSLAARFLPENVRQCASGLHEMRVNVLTNLFEFTQDTFIDNRSLNAALELVESSLQSRYTCLLKFNGHYKTSSQSSGASVDESEAPTAKTTIENKPLKTRDEMVAEAKEQQERMQAYVNRVNAENAGKADASKKIEDAQNERDIKLGQDIMKIYGSEVAKEK